MFGNCVEVDDTQYICNLVSEEDLSLVGGGITRAVLKGFSFTHDKWLYLPPAHARFPEELVGIVAQRITTLVPNREGKEEILEVFRHRPTGHWRQELYIITKFLPAEEE